MTTGGIWVNPVGTLSIPHGVEGCRDPTCYVGMIQLISVGPAGGEGLQVNCESSYRCNDKDSKKNDLITTGN